MIAGLGFAEPVCFYNESFGVYGDPYYYSLKDFPGYDELANDVTYDGTAGIWDYEPGVDTYLGYSGPYFIAFQTIGSNLYVKGINTLAHEDIKLSFGLFKRTKEDSPAKFSVEVCDGNENTEDPQNWHTILNTVTPTNYNLDTDNWGGVENEGMWKYFEFSATQSNIPATDNLWLRFTSLEGYQYILDDIMLCGEESVPKPVENVTQSTFHATIQAAIDAANSGDTILVSDGVYPENLRINTGITLIAENQYGATIQTQAGFPAGNGYGGITFLADGSTLDGFTIEQGVPQAVIHTHNANNVTIQNNLIKGINEASPRGIDVGYTSANSDNVSINDNVFESMYCGVYLSQATDLLIKDNDFVNMSGGGIVIDGGSPVGSVTVTSNSATDSGHLIYFYGDANNLTASDNGPLENTLLSNYTVINVTHGTFHNTIQAGVAAADDGEVVEAPAGTFSENVTIDKAITLRGAQSRDGLPIIQGTGVGSVVTIAADNVTLTGFQIQNSGSEPLDAGVLIYDRTGCQIIGNTVLGNANGIAVALGSGNTIQGNTINNNSLYGIGITASTGNTIEENNIFANGLDAIGLDNANIIGGPVSAGATGNLIKNNVIKSNRDGIFLGRNCNSNQIIEENEISDVAEIGIHVWMADSNIIDSNNISTSGTGIRVRGASANVVTENTITANAVGILVEPSQSGAGQLQSLDNTFKQNKIFDNTNFGATAIHVDQDGDIDMLENWWGDVTGPYHASTNSSGLGNAVTDNILFDPWMGQISGAELYVFAPKTLIQADENQVYSVNLLSVEDFRGYQMLVKIPKADFQEPTNVAQGPLFVDDPFFMAEPKHDDDYWIYDVASANMGAVEAINGYDIVLFTFEAKSNTPYDNTPNGCWIAVPLYEVRLRTWNNQPIPCLNVSNLNIIIDGTDPEAVINNAEEEEPYESPYLLETNPDGSGALILPNLDITCTDNYLLGYAQYIILPSEDDAPTTIEEFGDELFELEGDETTDIWQLDSDVNNLDDGEYTVYILVVDAAGNYTIIQWSFIKDATPPGPIVWDAVIPCRTTEKQDNFIDLKWVNPADAVENHIWVLSFGELEDADDYPIYGPAGTYPIPAAPNPYDDTAQNGWVKQIVIAPPATMPYALGFEERGYYYITIFAKDASGNFSAVPDAPFYRESISYWPGDVVGIANGNNHTVTSDDVSLLSAVWGLTSEDTGWEPIIDVGPTVDYARRSRPTPDGKIDIEDLMIFAMNYNNTVYSASYPRGEDNATPINIEPLVSYENDLMRVDFVISENSGFLRGLNIPFGFGSGLELQNVELGEIWPENSVVFHTNEDNMLTLSASTLGEAALEENGVFLTVKFRVEGNDVSTELFHMLARDLNNDEVEILNNPDTNPTSADDNVIVIPDTSYLGSNYPNPFNPSTTIQYGLKQAGNVKIGVYNSRGQLVRTLVSEAKSAGTYTAVWNGLDNYGRAVSSGIYFFRMDTADKTQVQKALLMK